MKDKIYIGLLVVFCSVVLVGKIGCRQDELKDESFNECYRNVKKIATAISIYQSERSGKYPRTLAELKPEFLETVPLCPVAKIDTYSDSFEVSELKSDESLSYGFVEAAEGDVVFRVFCKGNYHEGHPPNTPAIISQ